MQLEQAIYASVDGGRVKGYQLVARSDGVDRAMAQELCRWAPSHGALASQAPDAWSLSFFRISEDLTAVARTTYGGAEYSGRGGMQVVTLFLIIPLADLALYQNNALAVARTALALGYLRLPSQYCDYSHRLTLPDVPLPRYSVGCGTEVDEATVGSTLRLLMDRRRVAMVGCKDPIAETERVLERIPLPQRCGISFSTGLSWSMQRDFQLQFLPSVDPGLRQKMTSQNIVCTAV